MTLYVLFLQTVCKYGLASILMDFLDPFEPDILLHSKYSAVGS